MSREIWVAGYPSFYGGADTELDHNIDLWRLHGLEVHLVPMFGQDPKMRAKCDERGCTTHDYDPAIFAEKTVVSFCNGQFLERLPEIMANGRPAKVIWFNCMTWTFDPELEAHQQGWIDCFGFVSSYQESWLRPALEKIGPVKKLEGYQPYFQIDESLFHYQVPDEHFAMGRVSRDDAGKYASDMWNTFYKVSSPRPTKTFILGWGDHARSKCGEPPQGMDWMTYSPNCIPVSEFYRKLHCIIHKTGGSRESYCRIVPEAYAHGVPIIVEDDYAFPELVIDGETGFRCKSSDEMSFRASQLAFDEELRKTIVHNAFEHLRDKIASADVCWNAWEHVIQGAC